MPQDPPTGSRLPLELWSRANASLLGVAVLCSWRLDRAWPVACVSAVSLCWLGWAYRGAFTPSGRLGLANGVTSLRWLGVSSLAVLEPGPRVGPFALTVSAVLVLDLLDGWLARRRGDASPFGGHFDMETDALLVLVVTLRLWLVEGFASWVLVPGLLRYAYVVSLWLVPGTGREAPRSVFGRYAFAILMLGLLAGLLLPGGWGRTGVLLGTLAVAWSFGRSYYFSYASS